MLKFFRKYNKIILVFGASLLMVAFLIQPVIGLFMPDPNSRVIGEIDGEAVTQGEQRQYASELQVLSQLGGLGQLVGNDPLRWMLLVRDAQRLGLGASQAEVTSVKDSIGLSESRVSQLVQNLRVKEAFIDQAIRHWIMSAQYAELMGGQAYQGETTAFGGQSLAVASPAMQRLGLMNQAIMLSQQAQQAQQPFQRYQLSRMSEQFYMRAITGGGAPRMSPSLVEHVMQNQQSTISGETLVLPAEVAMQSIGEPSEAELEDLFQRYRDVAPGEGEPYGLGYRVPDRVKLTWLTVPIDAVRETVEFDYAQAVQQFDENPQQFQGPGGDVTVEGGADQITPEVMDRLRRVQLQEKAEAKAREMIRAAVGIVAEAERSLSTTAQGYREIPADFEPVDFSAVAAELEQRFGVRPEVQQRTEQWVDVDDASTLPSLGSSSLAGRQQINFPAYLASARGLEPDASNPLAQLRLQTGIASRAMVSSDGSMSLFRLTEAEPAHALESLEEIREQVVTDARRIAAYEQLTGEGNSEQWLQRAKEQGLSTIAQEYSPAVVNPVSSIPRTTFDINAAQTVPDVPGIGRSEAFINQAFELAERLADESGTISELPEDRRLTAVSVPSRLSLAVLRLDNYQRPTRSEYERFTNRPDLNQFVDRSLGGLEDVNPLSLEALQRRMNYTEEGAGQAASADDEGGEGEGA